MKKKHIIRLIVFLLLLLAADRIVGLVLRKLYEKSMYIDYEKIRYTMDSTYQDILIFGSSRATHHYIPNSIAKYTGNSVYNCGSGGQGLTFSYIQIHETIKRYKPKIIILDIAPGILVDPYSEQKLKILLPYYSRDTLIEYALTGAKFANKFKLYSHIYPYNGTIFNTLSALVYHRTNNANGYIPIIGNIDTNILKREEKKLNVERTYLLNQQCTTLVRIIQECKKGNVKLIFAISPIYKKDKTDIQIIDSICALSHSSLIKMLDFTADVDFNYHSELFKDYEHLNHNGSEKFSYELSRYLQNDL